MNIVKQLRERAGLQQKEVAVVAGVSRPTVSEWEHQKKDPSGERLQKLAELFNVDPSVVLGYTIPALDETPRPVTDDDIKFALFGEGDVSDEDYEDVKRYAAFIRSRKNNNAL